MGYYFKQHRDLTVEERLVKTYKKSNVDFASYFLLCLEDKIWCSEGCYFLLQKYLYHRILELNKLPEFSLYGKSQVFLYKWSECLRSALSLFHHPG